MKNQKKTMSDQVYNIIKEQIIKGYYYVDQKLTETGIAKVLDVSATPVREAFRRLEMEGFIKSIPYKGVFVRGYSSDEIECAYLMRAKIEGIALTYIINNMDDEMLTKCDDVFAQAFSNRNTHPLERYKPVHDWIIFGAKKDVIVDVLSTINAIINIDRLMHNIGEVDEDLIDKRHHELLDLIKGRKVKEAVNLIERMILYVLDIVLKKES